VSGASPRRGFPRKVGIPRLLYPAGPRPGRSVSMAILAHLVGISALVTSIHAASCRSTPCWIHRPWSPIRTPLPPAVFFGPVVDLLRLSPLLPAGSADRSHRERGAFCPRGMFLLRRRSRPL
jgi:hypothetical protein